MNGSGKTSFVKASNDDEDTEDVDGLNYQSDSSLIFSEVPQQLFRRRCIRLKPGNKFEPSYGKQNGLQTNYNQTEHKTHNNRPIYTVNSAVNRKRSGQPSRKINNSNKNLSRNKTTVKKNRNAAIIRRNNPVARVQTGKIIGFNKSKYQTEYNSTSFDEESENEQSELDHGRITSVPNTATNHIYQIRELGDNFTIDLMNFDHSSTSDFQTIQENDLSIMGRPNDNNTSKPDVTISEICKHNENSQQQQSITSNHTLTISAAKSKSSLELYDDKNVNEKTKELNADDKQQTANLVLSQSRKQYNEETTTAQLLIRKSEETINKENKYIPLEQTLCVPSKITFLRAKSSTELTQPILDASTPTNNTQQLTRKTIGELRKKFENIQTDSFPSQVPSGAFTLRKSGKLFKSNPNLSVSTHNNNLCRDYKQKEDDATKSCFPAINSSKIIFTFEIDNEETSETNFKSITKMYDSPNSENTSENIKPMKVKNCIPKTKSYGDLFLKLNENSKALQNTKVVYTKKENKLPLSKSTPNLTDSNLIDGPSSNLRKPYSPNSKNKLKGKFQRSNSTVII